MPSPSAAVAYFPKIDNAWDSDGLEVDDQALLRPDAISTVLDPDNAHLPIHAFDDAWHNQHYTRPRSPSQLAPIPPKPVTFSDRYLHPSLTRHERLRLTMLWYYTRDMTQDTELLQRLQDKVNLVQEITGWEFAIMGILDNHVYTRIATAGVPLATLPRRETTCAHTANQDMGVSK